MRQASATIESLLVCGFLWSGSSAAVDLLRSSESIGILPGEFDEFRRPGMVADHLEGLISEVYPSKLLPKQNFLSKIKTYIPFDRRLRYISTRRLDQLKRESLTNIAKILNDRETDLNQKMEYAHDWLESLKKAFAPDKKYLLMDQPILWGQHNAVWPELFTPFKMIAVARNPLDQMAEVVRKNHLFLHFRSPEADVWGGGRSGAFTYILHTLLVRILHYQKIREVVGADKILFVKFEDLVKHPSSVVQSITDFLGIGSDEIWPSKFFDPSVSMKNIGIYNEILTDCEILQLEELLKIYEANYEVNFRLESKFEKCFSHQKLKVVR